VPASASSPIAALVRRLNTPVTVDPGQGLSLMETFAGLTDPRARRGRRHALAAILTIAAAAVLAGARSLAAIGEWAADAPQAVLGALGARHDPVRGAYQPPDEPRSAGC
jgi:hypothetical protein